MCIRMIYRVELLLLKDFGNFPLENMAARMPQVCTVLAHYLNSIRMFYYDADDMVLGWE